MENYGYFKVACITPAVQIADVKANRKTMQKLLHSLPPDVRLAVFPELSLCAYTCQDLLYQNLLLDECLAALKTAHGRYHPSIWKACPLHCESSDPR